MEYLLNKLVIGLDRRSMNEVKNEFVRFLDDGDILERLNKYNFFAQFLCNDVFMCPQDDGVIKEIFNGCYSIW